MRRFLPLRRVLAAAAVLGAAAGAALAHDGPPYPVLVDEPFGGRTLSVWADPDVGVGTFYLYLSSEPTGPAEAPRITTWSRPLDDHLAETAWPTPPADPGAPYQHIARVDFDRQGPWHVRFVLESSVAPAELAIDVEVTPPGSGRLDVLWFLTPFLMVAFLWGKAMVQRASHARASSTK